MIRLSVESDYDGLIALWQEAFGDSEEAIRMFLDSRYKGNNTVVAEENGRIVSMLFLLEGKLKIKDKLYPSYYLYAAATAKPERGRGIMSEMLAFAEKTALSRNVDFICLKPAEESLYKYYGRLGYKTVFAIKSIKIDSIADSKSSLSAVEKIDWETVRNNAFSDSDGFIWDSSAIEYAVKQHLYYGGEILKSCNGFCLYTVEDRKCVVKEFCFTRDLLANIIPILNSKNKFCEITVDLPLNYDCFGLDGEIRNNGMALAVTDSAESIIDSINDAYLNLTLD